MTRRIVKLNRVAQTETYSAELVCGHYVSVDLSNGKTPVTLSCALCDLVNASKGALNHENV